MSEYEAKFLLNFRPIMLGAEEQDRIRNARGAKRDAMRKKRTEERKNSLYSMFGLLGFIALFGLLVILMETF